MKNWYKNVIAIQNTKLSLHISPNRGKMSFVCRLRCILVTLHSRWQWKVKSFPLSNCHICNVLYIIYMSWFCPGWSPLRRHLHSSLNIPLMLFLYLLGKMVCYSIWKCRTICRSARPNIAINTVKSNKNRLNFTLQLSEVLTVLFLRLLWCIPSLQ